MAKPEVLPRRHQRLVDTGRELGGHVELPPELAHVGDAGGAHGRRSEPDLPGGEERKRRIGEIGVGEAGEREGLLHRLEPFLLRAAHPVSLPAGVQIHVDHVAAAAVPRQPVPRIGAWGERHVRSGKSNVQHFDGEV